MTKPKIFIDLDDVCADLVPAWLKRYNELYQDNLTPEDVVDWDWTKFIKPECGVKIYRILDEEGFFENLPVIDGAVEGVEYISRLGFDVMFLSTSSARFSCSEKRRWVRKHFGEWGSKNLILTARKDALTAPDRILVDDGIHNCEPWVGPCVLVHRAHNREYKPPEGKLLVRAKDWHEIKKHVAHFKELMDGQ